MTSTLCILQRILEELKKLNERIAVRTNAVAVYSFDTTNTNKTSFNLETLFGSPQQIVATQLTIIQLGDGFTINVNNSGALAASYGYYIENEEIHNIEIQGNGGVGTGKIRIGATIT